MGIDAMQRFDRRDAPRKIFAHLINLKPTPEQLTYWMCHEEEIEKRVRGTELAAMIHATAPPQRSGVLGSLNMVADAFKLLPAERETKQHLSAYAWPRSGAVGCFSRRSRR